MLAQKNMLDGIFNNDGIYFNLWMNLTHNLKNQQLVLMDKRQRHKTNKSSQPTADFLDYDEIFKGPGFFYGAETMNHGDTIMFLSSQCYHCRVDTGKKSPPRSSIEARIILKGLDLKSATLLNNLLKFDFKIDLKIINYKR